LHINIVAKDWSSKVEKTIEPWIYEATGTLFLLPIFPFDVAELSTVFLAKRNGSISAEHGLGLMKAPYIGYSKSDAAVQVMQQLRSMFDKRRILSPHKYLPDADIPKDTMGAQQGSDGAPH